MMLSKPTDAAPRINRKSVSIEVGKSYRLKLVGSKKTVKWTSSNKKIATVSQKGIVRGISPGKCKVRAKVGNKKYTCKITVLQPIPDVQPVPETQTVPDMQSVNDHSEPVETTIKFSLSNRNISGKTTLQLSPVVNKEGVGLAWMSSNEEVATVSDTGIVNTLKNGTTGIIVTALDGSGANAVCIINVTGIEPEPQLPVVNGRVRITTGEGGNIPDLRKAIEKAYACGNADVILMPQEYRFSTLPDLGMLIGKGMRIIGTPGSCIIADQEYTGSGANEYVSVFMAGEGDFEIINVRIQARNVRYCVHDDPRYNSELGQTDGLSPARHVYNGCQMFIDNTENTRWKKQSICIGGGLGINTAVLIENCTFSAKKPVGGNALVTYHNSGLKNAEGSIMIKDSVFEGEMGVRFDCYGPSEKITRCYVTGCDLGILPYVRREDSAPYENMVLSEWNNHVRNADG